MNKLDYKSIDELVLRYQNGDEKAGEELISLFYPYLLKYFKLLTEGTLDLSDKDSRKFICLFIDDAEVRKKLKRVYQPAEVRHQAYLTATMLSKNCKGINPDDLMQELTFILLRIAKRYKKKKKRVNFCGYLYNAFRYELFRTISKIIANPLVLFSESNISYYDESYINTKDNIENNPLIYINEPVMLIDEELGNSWIRGLTAGEGFEQLTPLQRLILKLRYQEGMKDTEIAERTGYHRNTIRQMREEAIKILEKYL